MPFDKRPNLGHLKAFPVLKTSGDEFMAFHSRVTSDETFETNSTLRLLKEKFQISPKLKVKNQIKISLKVIKIEEKINSNHF